MTKFRVYYNKDRETEWINEMAREGYAMTGFFAGFYAFEECEPGEYIYQIDFTQEFGHVHSNYREFMRETGVEIVSIWGFWIFLRRKAAEGSFELYTDVESTIAHYSKIRRVFKVALGIELGCLIVEILAALNGAYIAKGMSLLIIAIAFALAREVVRLNEILAELKSRLGEYDSRGAGGRRGFSKVLLAGLLLNFVALQIDNPAYEAWKHGLTLFAILLMGAGIVLSFLKRD